jgi:8-oxo-dGTP diphosphatase
MTRHCWRCAAALPGPPPVSCVVCGQEHYNNPKPAAEAIVVRGGQILLIRRATEPWAGHWDIPGGFCDAGEHPARAAERELLEETGLPARARALIGIWMDVYGEPAEDGLVETTMNVSYLLELIGSPPGAEIAASAGDGEASELAWFDLGELPAELAFPDHAHAVLAALRDVLDGDDYRLDGRQSDP